MKQTILLLSLFFIQNIGFIAWGQTRQEGIRFEQGTWEEVLAKAKTEKKLLFVDVWATWCGPCKKLASDVFPQKEVGNFFNKHFICYQLQIDIEDKALRDKYQQLARTYNAAALPTLLWIDEKGKLEHFSIGYRKAEDLLEEGRKALDPSLRTSHITDNWDSQPHTLANGLVYFEAHPEETAKFDEFFLALTPEEQLSEQLNVLLYFKLTLSPDSKALHYMAAKKDSLATLYPKAKEWNGMLESQIRRLLGATPLEELDTLAAKFAAYKLPFLPQLTQHIRSLMLFRFEKIDEGFKSIENMIQQYGSGKFLRDFVDVTFFMATKQHTLFTAEQKRTILTWAQDFIVQIEDKDSYIKDLVLFEAYALNGMKAEAMQHIDRLKQQACKGTEENRLKQCQFYDELAESMNKIQ